MCAMSRRLPPNRVCSAACILLAALLAAAPSARGADTRMLNAEVADISGKPVPGAELYLYRTPETRRPADFISRKTGADGRVAVPLPGGKYWVTARVRQGAAVGPLSPGDLHSGMPLEIDLEGGDFDVLFTVADPRVLARGGDPVRGDMVRVTGRIVTPAGTPVPGAYAGVWRNPATDRLPDAVSPWTECDGTFTIYLFPGEYSVSAEPAFPPPPPGGRVTSTVSLTSAGSDHSLMLRMSAPDAGRPNGCGNPAGEAETD